MLQGKYAEAEPLHGRAAEIMEKALGPEHPDVATTLSNWAGVLKEQVIVKTFGLRCGRGC